MDASRQSVGDTGLAATQPVAGGGRERSGGTGAGDSSSLRESETLVEVVGGSSEESERESRVAVHGKGAGPVMEEASASLFSREGNSGDGGDEEAVRREIAGGEAGREQVPANVEHDDDVWEVGVHRGQTRQSDIEMAVKMVKAVEDDARAVAGSLSMLFSTLQAGLTPVTESSVQHMQCYSEAAGLLQDAAIDAATKGNRFVNACLRLNEEMKGVGNLAAQLKNLRQVVDQFEYHISRILPRM